MSGKPSILIVDPTPDAALTLFADEFEVLLAKDAPKGLGLARTASPSLILLDASLRNEGALKLCGQIRKEASSKDTPILLMGAAETDSAEAEAITAGFTDFLAKPLRPASALARVRGHLEAGQYKSILRQVSWIDPVTGLPNESHLEQILQGEWRRAARNRTALALILITLDHAEEFKKDQGRQALEDCQRRLASIFTGSIQRAGDGVARYAGTGFACVLPETDNIGAVSVCERFRAEVHTAAIPNPRAPLGILTVSLGLATLIPTRGETLADLKTAAEEALSRATLRGGNQVVWS